METNNNESKKVKERPPKTKYSKYFWFLVIYAALYEIFDSYNTSFYPTIVSGIEASLGINDSQYYLLLTLGSIGLYVVILMQYLSDLIGRKPTVIISFFGMGLSVYLLAQSNTAGFFGFSLFLMYIFFSSDSWVIMLSEESPKEKRGIYSYVILLFGVIGVLIIPFLRTLLFNPENPSSWVNMTYIGWIAMPIALLGIFLRETPLFKEQKNANDLKKNWSWNILKQKFKTPFSDENKKKMIGFIIIGIVVGLNYASFQTIESFFTSTLSVSVETISNIIFIAGMGSLLVFGFTGTLIDKFGRRIIFIIYSTLLTGGIILLVIMTVNQILIGIFVFVIIAQIGFWGCFTLLKVFCVESFSTEIRGAASGWRSFSFAIGFTIGSLVSSKMAQTLSLGSIYIALSIWAVILIPIIVIKLLPETKALDLSK